MMVNERKTKAKTVTKVRPYDTVSVHFGGEPPKARVVGSKGKYVCIQMTVTLDQVKKIKGTAK